MLASKISASEQDVFLIVIKGFGMHIRQYVFMKYPENMQELIDIAKIAQNIPKPLTFNEAAFRDSVSKCLSFEFNKLLDKQALEGNKKAVNKKGKACGKCGTFHEDNNCPAANELCNYCQRLGHFQRKCRIARRGKKHNGTHQNSEARLNPDAKVKSCEPYCMNEATGNYVADNSGKLHCSYFCSSKTNSISGLGATLLSTSKNNETSLCGKYFTPGLFS